MQPASFSDLELQIICEAAQPLPPNQRASYLRAVAYELANCRHHHPTPAIIHNVAGAVQRRFLTSTSGPPSAA